MSITLPPLPVPAITMKHGPWKPSQFDDYETYCAHCLTRSIFAHSRRCDQESTQSHSAPATSKWPAWCWRLRLTSLTATPLVDRWADAILRANADAIRALEVRHHE